MTKSQVVKLIEQDIRKAAWISCIKQGGAILTCTVVLASTVALITGSHAASLTVTGCAGLMALIFIIRKTLRSSSVVREARLTRLAQQWVAAAPDAAAAQLRRKVWATDGLEVALTQIERDFSTSVRIQAQVKAEIRERGRQKLLRRRGTTAPLAPAGLLSLGGSPANPYEGQVSGSGQLLSATGLDFYGDGVGSRATRDFLEASVNENTGSWSTSGQYQPPI